MSDLAERVLQFQMMELPSQPRMMHMGTSKLVSELDIRVRELEAENAQLRAELGGRPTQWAYEQVCKADEEQRTEIAQLLLQLYEVREIYTGSDGFIPATAPEAYCLRIMYQMYRAALTEGERNES